jgi:hypothetical protein
MYGKQSSEATDEHGFSQIIPFWYNQNGKLTIKTCQSNFFRDLNYEEVFELDE